MINLIDQSRAATIVFAMERKGAAAIEYAIVAGGTAMAIVVSVAG